MAKTTVLIASPSPVQRARLANLARASSDLDVIALTANLPETFTISEAREPEIVIVSDEFLLVDEWTAMQSLFSALGTGWLVAGSGDARLARDLARTQTNPFVDPGQTPEGLAELIRKTVAQTPSRRLGKTLSRQPEATLRYDHLVVIGASTGGVDALLTLLSEFPKSCPPTAIVQHTGRGFSDSLIRLLDRRCAPEVLAARDGMTLIPGRVCVAAGSDGHLVLKPGVPPVCQIRPGPPISGHTPSVDALFQSALPLAPNVVGVILTGMGQDGASGLLGLRQAGCQTIGQDEATSVVYGMPRAAWNLGAVQRQLPLDRIGAELVRAARAPATASGGDAPSRSAAR